jgi:phosphate transport system protein
MKKFEHELDALQQKLADMGRVTIEMVAVAACAVADRSVDLSEKAAKLESQINQMQVDIDGEAMRLLTVYGPVASSLREILVMTHVTAQFERIGDQVVNVCESLQMMKPGTEPVAFEHIRSMSELAAAMVEDAILAYSSSDTGLAEATRAQDDMVDSLNALVVSELLSDEVVREVVAGRQDVKDSLAEILIARHFERIADQAVNVCKEVVFMVRGDDVRHRSKAKPESPPATE